MANFFGCCCNHRRWSGRAAPCTRRSVSAGRWPATSKAKAAIRGRAGRVRLRGPLQVRPC